MFQHLINAFNIYIANEVYASTNAARAILHLYIFNLHKLLLKASYLYACIRGKVRIMHRCIQEINILHILWSCNTIQNLLVDTQLIWYITGYVK